MPPAPASALLSALRDGPVGATELRARLRLSPATFSRRVAQLGPAIVSAGATRSLQYAARRTIAGLPSTLPLYELLPGRTRLFATLTPIARDGFLVESDIGPVRGLYAGLPWFLEDLRPAGFLGRLVPRTQPDLGLPEDLRAWSNDHTIRWLHEWGVDTVGAFVLGDPAYARAVRTAPHLTSAAARSQEYPSLAEAAMSFGVPGSSAAGEQPKFLACRDGHAVLVKFSPRLTDAAARRTADLLRCEHHALTELRATGVPAAATEVVEGSGRVFLEVERFDRSDGGRLGLVSLFALASHHGATLARWTESADELLRRGVLTVDDVVRITWLDRFGALIGNTDRHPGNLSFRLVEGRVTGVAPAYDVLPMRYAVRAGEFDSAPLVPPVPTPRLPEVWREAWDASVRFWERVASDGTIDGVLRGVARTNADALRVRRRDLQGV